MYNPILTTSEFIRCCNPYKIDKIQKQGDNLTITLPTGKLEISFTDRGISIKHNTNISTKRLINSILVGASYSDLVTVPYSVKKYEVAL